MNVGNKSDGIDILNLLIAMLLPHDQLTPENF